MTTRKCKACDGSGYVERFTWCGWLRCDACAGTGSITDHIPASDAIADAETLWRYWRENWHAVSLATDAKWRACGGYIFPTQPLYCGARMAANEAFRAVPGLRG